MIKIVLIRPGSTDYAEEGRVQGTLDMPLNEHGAEEVARITNELQPLEIAMLY
jgi:probable phosphoglycerate mutase